MAYVSAGERREQIIDAAVDVIAREGLARATTRRIAERAGAPLSVLHYCFENKGALLLALAVRAADMLDEYFVGCDPAQGVESTIRQDIDALWRWYQDHTGLQLALLELGMARVRRGGSPDEIYAMWNRFGREVMLRHLNTAVTFDRRPLALPVEEIVRFILHRFDGLTLELAASQDVAACQRQVDLLGDAIIRLALPSAP